MNNAYLDNVESMLKDEGEERTPAQETALETIQSLRTVGYYNPEDSPESAEAKLQTALSLLLDGEDSAVNNVCSDQLKKALARHRRQMSE